jgi:hypothetical protein
VKDYVVFNNMSAKIKFRVVHDMKSIFLQHVDVLQNKAPKDGQFRKQIIGQPFWAQGQEYTFAPLTGYVGILLHFSIRRGGVGQVPSKASI